VCVCVFCSVCVCVCVYTKQHTRPHPPTHSHTHTHTHPPTHTRTHLKGEQKTGSRHQRHCFALADQPLIPPSPSPSICPPTPPHTNANGGTCTHTHTWRNITDNLMPAPIACFAVSLPSERAHAPETGGRERAHRERERQGAPVRGMHVTACDCLS
jgi:hypothetical protein